MNEFDSSNLDKRMVSSMAAYEQLTQVERDAISLYWEIWECFILDSDFRGEPKEEYYMYEMADRIAGTRVPDGVSAIVKHKRLENQFVQAGSDSSIIKGKPTAFLPFLPIIS
jgi:hypothetical protein